MSPRRTSGGSPLTVALSGGKGRNSAQLSLQDTPVLAVEEPGREQAWSRSPLWGREGRSRCGDRAGCEHPSGSRRDPPSCGHAPRDAAASPGPCGRSLQRAGAPRAAEEQTLLGPRETSRSVLGGYELRGRFVQHTEHQASARKRRRQTANPPLGWDQAPVDSAVPGPSSTSLEQAPVLSDAGEQSQPKGREQSR